MYLLLLLLMSSLAVPPVLSQTYQAFLLQHTYNKNTFVDCTRDLNPILRALNKACKPCNTFILGDHNYITDTNDVAQVCTTGGTRKRNTNLYQSRNNFHVVKCRLKSGAQPPNCVYRKVTTTNIRSTQITVACKNNRPVHLEPC